MIDKREILDNATSLGLTPHVVEKDYESNPIHLDAPSQEISSFMLTIWTKTNTEAIG